MPTHHTEKDDAQAMSLLALADTFVSTRALEVAAEIGIADHFTGPRPVADLATETKTQPAVLRMLLRVLAAHGLFAPAGRDEFVLTEAGGPLRSDHPRSLRAMIRLHGIVHQAVVRMDHTLATGELAFPHVHHMPAFEFFRQSPERAAVFDTAMAELSRLECSGIVRDYDFSGHQHIVDVGGGSGTLLATVLVGLPAEVTGTVMDQPHVVTGVPEVAGEHGVAGRLQAVGGDFFASVPSGGSLYMLKSVLHDWPDKDAIRILTRCREAIPRHGKLLLFERMIHPDSCRPQTEQYSLLLHILYGGMERTRTDFEALFAASGFRLEHTADTAQGLSALEAIPV